MNIWIINHYAIPPSMGGLVRHYYFSKYLKEKGHNIKIFTSSRVHNTEVNMISDNSFYIEKDMDGVEYTFVRTSDYSSNGIDRIINMLQFPIRIWSVCKRFEKPDVIYTSSPDLFTVFSAVLMAKKLRVKKVVEVRDLWPESIIEFNGMSRKNPIIKILFGLEKWIYKQADKLIFTMEGGKQYIIDKNWGKSISLEKIYHVNNGVDLYEYEQNVEKYQLHDEDLDRDDVFKIVYAGSIRKANNIEQIIKAVEKLNASDKCLLLLYGDGNERAELESYCVNRGLQNIHFKGMVDKKYIPYILSKSNLNIINYKPNNLLKYGGSQNKLFEYLASGVPVCSNVEMGYSIIMNNNCGIEKNIMNAEDYSESIRNFIEMDADKYDIYSQNAKETAKKYDYHILANEIEIIMNKVLVE